MALSDVTRVPVHRNANYKANGTKSLVWLYNKYNITPTRPGRYHRDEKNRLMKRQEDGSSAEVTAEDQQNDSYYTCPVTIGTPGQQLDVTFDSGSADFWVWSSYLPESTKKAGSASGGTIYDPTKSSTQKPMTGSSWQIRYGDGSSASGIVTTDVLQVGDIKILGQPVEIATDISPDLATETGSQGILGLAFGNINNVSPVPVKTPLDNMIAQEDIPKDQEVFTCYMGSYKDAKDPDNGTSFFTFGKIDSDVVHASGREISYTPVNDSNGFWEFASEFVVINGQKTLLPGNTAIADTATTLMIIDDDLVEKIYSAIPGAVYDKSQQGWLIPSNTPSDKIPDVAFAVGDVEIVIDKEQIAFAPIPKSGMVYGGIQGRGGLPYNVYGDTFLKCVYAVFDAGKKQFGVVQRVNPGRKIAF
ncbi:uncharacterized protein Z520_09264 [Fonsecaea multimorphosa CBS 102226]|uniref:Peptidase A1 domain-containing protein n=1 Tax=Fonsecaea multimorphosa CBS 102226 TaxID=1442371 RepID=A0A0D2JWT8_9EURO|nr:uncharacterized protein Z520_09264 [Fonsecaea multimorphosa CBS 102226]KIX94954.1 hypothetical protein Z520_09264 [Fonsecaea multimorphosa CBS 102226]OAL20605.1 hypothetical protein AYO22_08614 [Fonsecaea multimorphosa]